MSYPFRVVIWGPGGLGAVTIWEVLQSPHFELVGVKAYSEDKKGIDAGEYVGRAPCGVKFTTDVQRILDTDADCVVFTARDYGDYRSDEDILKLLRSGKNVVTPLPYQNAHLFRDAEFMEKLSSACEAGKSVFHASGINPEVVSERLLLGLSGMCTHIEQLKIQENWEASGTKAELLSLVGFGKSREEAMASPYAASASDNFLASIGYTAERALGVKYDRVTITHDYIVADQLVETANFTVRPGQVGRMTHRFNGYIDSVGPAPFFIKEYNWVIGNAMLPAGVLPDQYYIICIEGRPSLRMVLDIRASLQNKARFYEMGTLHGEPGYVGTMAPCLHSIPIICSSKPGILNSLGPVVHWMQDIRAMGRRN